MVKDNSFIVENGRLICYYPLEIKEKKKINQIRSKIQTASIVISEEKEFDGCRVLSFKDKYIERLEEKERNTLFFLKESDILKQYAKDENITFDIPETPLVDTNNILEKEDWILSVEIENSNKINIGVESNSKKELIHHLDSISDKRELSKKVYGVHVADYYTEYLLLPIYAKNKAGNDIQICIILQIYENGMAIIKTDIPIRDDKLGAFYDDDYDSMFQEIKVSKCIVAGEHEYNTIKTNKLSYVMEIYKKKLCEVAQVNVLQFAQFNHVLLIKCNPPIKAFDKLSDITYEAIYRLLAAPIATFINIQEEMKLYCDENYWGSNGIRYYFGKTGRCVSIIDEGLQKYVEQKESDDNRNAEYRMQEMMEFNIEYCINILLLEYINSQGRYWNSLKRGNNLEVIKKEYCETELMILEMKEYCFGSVLELLEQMENSMKYYLKRNLINAKNEYVERIIQIKENKKKLIMKKFIEIVGFLYTLFFGLPVITDTISILNQLFSFEIEGENIIIRTSFLVWLVMVGGFMVLAIKESICDLYSRIKKFFGVN